MKDRLELNLRLLKLHKTPLDKLRIKKLSLGVNRTTGRSGGKIVSLYRGGGHKRSYRFLDIWRNQFPEEIAIVRKIEKDPFRSAPLGTLIFSNGYITQVIISEGTKIKDPVRNDLHEFSSTSKDLSSSIRLKNARPGTILYGIELYPNNGQKICRSAGSSAAILKGMLPSGYFRLKLKSGEIRLIHKNSMASIGVVGNVEHFLRKKGKAGINRWLGWRPRVRPSAMNPVDHPMGGRTKGGSPAMNRKGLLSTKVTRNNPRTEPFILVGHRARKYHMKRI